MSRLLARSSLLKSGLVKALKGGHRPMAPPFARLKPPSKTLPEQVELIWDDGVAPETCIDFDSPQVSTKQVFASFFTAFGIFGSIFAFCVWYDPETRSEVVRRKESLPENWMHEEIGYPRERPSQHPKLNEIKKYT